MQLLINTDYTVLILENSMFFSARPSDRHNAETNQRCDVINFVTLRSEILHRIPTVKTARTLRLCCVFCNCMEYSATWDVLIDQVMYILIRITEKLFQCHCQNAWHWSQL